ncbi:MAG: hypothetical protein R2856_25560 [Caldilineaceae bacterium]
MITMKFGGTSVGSTDSIAQVAEIVAQKVSEQAQTSRPGVVVVTSAMSGVTNSLIDSAYAAANGDEGPYRESRSQLLVKHQVVAGQLIEDGVERANVGRLIDGRLQEYERLCRSIAVLGELTPAVWTW